MHNLYMMILEMPYVFYFFAFALGCCIGSFLNVCIWRIPRGESIVTAPSHCPECAHNIRWYENIPLISWLALGGRCSSCKQPITIRYFMVELLTGVLFLLAFYKVLLYQMPLTFLPLYFGLIMLAVCTAFIDIKHLIIPDRITYPAAVLGMVSALAFPETWHLNCRLLAGSYSIFTMLGCLFIMGLIGFFGEKIFKKEALGGGDVKYMAAVGACVGPIGAFGILLIASLLGTVVGLAILFRSDKERNPVIPFGPFLAAATCIWILTDYFLINCYLRTLPPLQ